MDSYIVKSFIIPMQATKYATVASITLMLWDIGLTLDEEIYKIWRAKKCFGNFLFLVNRYMPLGVLLFDLYAQFVVSPSIMVSFCRNYQLSTTIVGIASLTVVECILLLRTHALYQRTSLFMFLSILCLVTMGAMLSCFMILFEKETFRSAKKVGLPGCLSFCHDKKFCRPAVIASFWVPFFLFETVIFAFTLAKSCKAYKALNLSKRATLPKYLLQILVRDGVLYYFVIMSVSLCNLLMWALYPGGSYIAVDLLRSLQSVICSRILLNLRRSADDAWIQTEMTAGVEFISVSISYDIPLSTTAPDYTIHPGQ
ncbi:hypothetical protein BDN70DRAFT_874316 [Pholiota conissans]|uniref:DUF6533 domain-containing protein n=1 Tax=Pholiota conissans TaxID=109636 RepID=A0A9P5Z8M3_9AGAR|nr:hypothetical protein BDN70DRAFT_874316 [Pholiota conissans]